MWCDRLIKTREICFRSCRIWRDLALGQEIKDGIYHLALRLHRLYQHQKERNTKRKYQNLVPIKSSSGKKERTKYSLKYVNIKLDGGRNQDWIKRTKKKSSSSAKKCKIDFDQWIVLNLKGEFLKLCCNWAKVWEKS